MAIKYFTIIFILFIFNSCAPPSYKFEKNSDGEPILESDLYTLNKNLTNENFKVIDTSCYYIETFAGLDSNENQRANPFIFKFHKDGYYKEDSYLYFGKFDNERTKKSVFYGGKYSIDGEIIFLESFYPIKGGKTSRYSKVISKGIIKNDTIFIEFFGTPHKFVRKNYNQIFN
jgi:hypothetical protein